MIVEIAKMQSAKNAGTHAHTHTPVCVWRPSIEPAGAWPQFKQPRKVPVPVIVAAASATMAAARRAQVWRLARAT
jgi:hypothetical protein